MYKNEKLFKDKVSHQEPQRLESFAQFIQFLIVRYAYRLYWT